MVVDSENHSLESLGILKQLAANDRPTREAGISALETYLKSSRGISQLDFLKLWKGLYYCMWMTDRPKAQQDMATKLSSLLLITDDANATNFLESFWATICREWNNVDVLRVDKFYLLIRQVVHMMFRKLRQSGWEMTLVEQWMDILISYPLSCTNTSIPDGIRYHMIDIYIDELERSATVPEITETYHSNTKTTPKAEDHRVSSARQSDFPIARIMRPFELLARDGKSKVAKKRVITDVLSDTRLKSIWKYDAPQTKPPTDMTHKPTKRMRIM
ncbi:hypothetical protein V1525DRAFT_385711 [Lipomyces kononenkoae]|uniref:Uncharacterized protein n=1 Tax=Lipomyces kononenkoae TaxID=34357 RepID=A0ACC3T9R3_LIPKO